MTQESEQYYYDLLKDDSFKRKGNFRCPFCWSYNYENLWGVSKQAERIMNDTNRNTKTERDKHTAVKKYIDSLDTKTGHVKSSTFKTGRDEMFVWPWTVILANNAKKKNSETGKYVRKNEQEIKKQLCSEGYKFSEVLLFSNNKEQTEFAIVIFGKESTDFSNAIELEDAFKLEKRGKEDYFKKKKNQDLGDQHC